MWRERLFGISAGYMPPLVHQGAAWSSMEQMLRIVKSPILGLKSREPAYPMSPSVVVRILMQEQRYFSALPKIEDWQFRNNWPCARPIVNKQCIS
jgi:hypothetical protein